MRYLSVCSGIEAATVAWHPLGWQPLAFAEIEPFPAAVLAHHYPNVPNLGDMTKFMEWSLPDGSVDLLVGGTPCQSFSVAGLRKGLADPRGNLMLTYLAIAQRHRPRWIVWENVPGVLSSNRGRDFGTFLGALGDLGYGWSYRVLDAQWFGVAQRRKRVFVVGHLGDATRAAAVLFESESVRRNTPPSREARQRVAATAAGSAGKRGQQCLSGEGSSMRTSASHANAAGSHIADTAPATTPNANVQVQCKKTCTCTKSSKANYTHCAEITSALCAADGPKGVSDQYAHEGKLICLASGQAKAEVLENCCSTLTCLKEVPIVAHYACKISDTLSVGANQTTGTPTEVVAEVTYGANLVLEDQGGSVINVRTDGTVGTLRRETHGHEPAVISYGFEPGIAKREGDPQRFVKEMTPTLRRTMGDNQVSAVIVHGTQDPCVSDVAFAQGRNNGGENVLVQPFKETSDCLTSAYGTKWNGNASAENGSLFAMNGMAVRRLTPVECERLQGFPDGYTNIPWRKKPEAPDGPRYKALGNSMATPVMRWIGERIARVEAGLSAAPAKS